MGRPQPPVAAGHDRNRLCNALNRPPRMMRKERKRRRKLFCCRWHAEPHLLRELRVMLSASQTAALRVGFLRVFAAAKSPHTSTLSKHFGRHGLFISGLQIIIARQSDVNNYTSHSRCAPPFMRIATGGSMQLHALTAACHSLHSLAGEEASSCSKNLRLCP